MQNNMETFTGALEDPRSEEQINRDYTHEEQLGMGAGFNWEEKTTWTKLSKRDQNGSSSCGAQSAAKAMEFYKNVVESAVPIFRRRSNYPSQGMYLQEVGSILLHKGTLPEKDCPSQIKNDTQMDTTSFTDTPDIISGYYNLPIKDKLDMDLIAQAFEKGHALIFGVYGTYEEWQAVPVTTDKPHQFSHMVCSVPKNYLLHNGEKSVVIDDTFSHGTSIENSGQRILTESFLKSRCWGILALIPPSTVVVPTHTFNVNMVYGDKGEEVKKLQEFLISQGFLQKGFSTGYFGVLTLKAVMAFQQKYAQEILKPVGLTQPNGKCLKFTMAKLNQLYAN